MTDRPGLDFSFSGLKTFAMNTIADSPGDPETRAAIARADDNQAQPRVRKQLCRVCVR